MRSTPKFTHLHVHSHYSLLDGLSKIDDLINLALELGMDSLALTDHGVMYGAIEFYEKAKKAGLKPIIGEEFYIAPRLMENKEPKIDTHPFHLVLLAKNKQGYQNLVKLTTQAWLKGFYYKPRIDKPTLEKHSEGLIALSACVAGEIPRTILNKGIDEAKKVALNYQNIFGPGNFYLELEHHPSVSGQEKVNQGLIQISKATKIPLVAAYDSHYLHPEDAQAQDILMQINTQSTPDDRNRLTMKNDDFSLVPPEKMFEWYQDLPEAIENTQIIADQCNLELTLGQSRLPYFPIPTGQSPGEYLQELVQRGAEEKYKLSKLPSDKREIIENRIKYELSVIKATGFASYFLIVADFVNWAKEKKIVVGPGRGSAAGSIISYCLKITNIDPLKYNLLFERFLNPERISMPDIDMDFADTRRDEVIEYVRQKYGAGHIAQIITFGTMAARAVVRDVTRAMGFPYSLGDQIAKSIPPMMDLKKALESTIELNQLYKTNPQVKKVIDIALKLEGVARHASTHACGVVISDQELTQIIPLQRPTQDNQAIVTQYDGHSVEKLGLLKMDFLGLRNLSIIENTLKIIKKLHRVEINIEKIPLDDQKTFDLLQKGQTTGVFQLESDGMKHYLRELKPTKFEDIIAMVALYRPGPMQFIPEFIARKHGYKKTEYLHPKLEAILKNTYGICLYQEQLMRIARDLAGFSLAEADVLRKAVGKKIKKLLDQQKEKLIQGMIKNKISADVANKIWHWVEPFASYGFNKSHSTCYAMIAYQTAYLKTHWPIAFMTALLNTEKGDIERVAFLINECQKMGFKILPPDINESLDNFTIVDEKVIRFGMGGIKNVGENIIQSIVQIRKSKGQFTSVSDLVKRVQNKDLNRKSLESLIKSGALDCLGERGQLLENLDLILNYARQEQKMANNGQISLFGNLKNNALSELKLKASPPASQIEKLSWEKELLGLYVSEHPINYWRDKIKSRAVFPSQLSSDFIGQQVNVGGVITKIHKIITKSGQPMLFVTIEDNLKKIEIIVFPTKLTETANVWQDGQAVIVSGRLDNKDGQLKVLCDQVRKIE